MRKQISVLLASCWATTAVGQDLLQCIDPDVRDGLLWATPLASLEPVFSNVPAEIAALRVPAGFAWIGGADRGASIAGAYKTSGDTQAAFDAAVGAMVEDGWTSANEPSMSGAFASATMQRSQTMCRDGTAVGIGARVVHDTTYVNYSIRKSSERSSCDSRAFEPPSRRDIPNFPTFDYSAFSASPGFPGGGSGSSSGLSAMRSQRVTVNASLAALANELARQLGEQGWRQDSAWSGAVTAGSVWMRTVDGTRFGGTLDIVAQGASKFDVAFDLNELP